MPKPPYNYTNSATGIGLAFTDDYVTISSAGHTGVALLTFSFLLDGQATWVNGAGNLGDVSGGAGVYSTLDINGHAFENVASMNSTTFLYYPSPITSVNNTTTVNGIPADPFGFFSYTVPVTLGSPFELYMQLRAGAGPSLVVGRGGSVTGDGAADAMHTFAWAGIQDVSLNGVPIDYSVRSLSGTDWSRSFVTTAVPEPSSIALLFAALGSWPIVSRRIKSGRR